MADRAVMERVIRDAYAARVKGDVDGVMSHFADNVSFSLAGCPSASAIPCSLSGSAEVRGAMERLLSAFDFSDLQPVEMLIDGNGAAVHWRIQLRSAVTGETAETELVDLFRFEGDKIASLRQFADTALAHRMLGQ